MRKRNLDLTEKYIVSEIIPYHQIHTLSVLLNSGIFLCISVFPVLMKKAWVHS